MTNKTVLVTGAAGFTGRHLVATLERQGFEVAGLGPPNTAGPLASCDLTDLAQTSECVRDIQPDYVVHLAALSHVALGNTEAYYRVNLFGTLNLLDAIATCGKVPDKILIASSANIYGAPAVERIDESICPQPVNHYANSKLAMEHMVATWFSRLPIVVTRPFNYTGPGQEISFLIPKIVDHFRRKAPAIELGNLDVYRDFSDVRDVAEIYSALLQSEHHSTAVNVCSGAAISLKDIVRKVEEISGHSLEIRVNPAFVRPNEIPRLWGDDTKLKQLIGEVPHRPMAATLSDMLTA